MAIDTTTAASSARGSAAVQTAANRLSSDYQSFLKLLTAQLANQDPLEPMDSSTFVTQLAQLSQVEQAITMNSNLDLITTQLANAGLQGDMQFIGRTVTVPSTKLVLTSGSADFGLVLGATAKAVTAEVLADDGTVIRRFEDLPTAAGAMHRVDWDGLDGVGLPVPDGTFQVKLTALDADGNAIGATTYTSAKVQRLSLDGWISTLHLSTGETAYSGQVVAVE